MGSQSGTKKDNKTGLKDNNGNSGNNGKSSFSLYTTALLPFLTAAEDMGKKRLDASFRLSHVDVKISCQSLLRHGHALFTRKVLI